MLPPWPRRSPWPRPARGRRRRCGRRSAGTARRSAAGARVRYPGAVIDHLEQHRLAVGPGAPAPRPVGGSRSALEMMLASTRSSRPGSARTAAPRPAPRSPACRGVQAAQGDRGHLLDRGRAAGTDPVTGVQPVQVEQVPDQRVQPIGVCSMVASSSASSAGPRLHVGLAQAADAGLDRGQRGAQIVADRGEQGGPDPVALGQRLGLRACTRSRSRSRAAAACAP